ncbi:MAG: carboxypeptidase regulatory-like domain-containing protein [Terriglobia bacterium]
MLKRVSLLRGVAISIAVLLLLLVAGRGAFAQSTGSIQGTVTDPSGAVVPGVQITAHNQATGVDRTTTTNPRGTYVIPDLPYGTYLITARATGFEAESAGNLQLAPAVTLVQNFALRVGTAAQAVTVTGTAPLLNTANMQVGKVINETTVQQIPLNGRHFVDLALLLPGSVIPPQNGFLTAPIRGQGMLAFNTAGSREDTVNFMINGINLNDMVQNQITFQPPISTVAEFNATNSTFSAEYSRNSGAIVNVATRSGTNEFHGEAFEYVRNDIFDAKNLFDNPNLPIPPFKRNQFGGDAGGPILKNRLFFFGSYEAIRQRQAVPFNTVVPTAAERATATNGTVENVLNYVPLPNVGATSFQGSGSAPVLIDDWTGDIMYRIANSDTLHGYYAFQRDSRHEPSLQGNNVPGFGDIRPAHRQLLTVNETHIFGPATVNDFRMGFNRLYENFNPATPLNPSSLGIADGVTSAIGIPQISVAGSFNVGGPAGFPQGRGDTVYVWSDTVSRLEGNHSLKFGADVRRFQNNNFGEDVGSMTFTSIPNFLAGNVNSFTINASGTFSSIRTTGLGLFAQDDWKLKPNLTLELGLRWDENTTPSEVFNRFVVFVPATDSLARIGSNGIGQPFATNDKDFGPRFGFAWQPFRNGKMVVRSGYGIYYDQPVTNDVTGLASNPPFGVPLNAVATATNPLSIANPMAGSAGKASTSPSTINHNFQNDYVQEWNLSLQHQLSSSLAVEAEYVGSKGTHLRMSWNPNQFELTSSGAQVLVNGAPVRPYAGFSNISEIDSPGNSSYNALWLTVTKQISHGLQVNGSYTWSHSLDLNSLSSQGIIAQNNDDLENEYGSSDFDARSHFNVSYIYDLPFHGNRLAQGWEVAGVTTFQSGNPVNLILSTSSITGTASVRPNLIGDPYLSNPNPAAWFNVAAFCVPGAAGCGASLLGDFGRNVLAGPGFDDFDFSVIKNTKITESTTVQFRAEAFNIFNNPNLGQPGRVVKSATFGRITSTRFSPGDTGSARQIQLALRFMF